MKNQNCSLLNVNSLVKALLLTFLVLIVGYRADANMPGNFPASMTTKKYRTLPNPLIKIKPGEEVEVLVINGKAYLEGDIYLGTVEELDRFQAEAALFSHRVDTNPLTGRWEGGVIPFVIPDEFTEAERQVIINAMNHYSANTNVCFRRRTNQSSYIRFKKSTDIFGLNYAGSATLGKCTTCLDGQDVNLVMVNDRTVRHEIGHALGLMHEHNREDRDSRIEILWDNVALPMHIQFLQTALVSTDVGNYDFNSIMHYHSRAFGRTVGGQVLQTIRRRANPNNTNFGTTSVLSAGDIAGINSMYPNNVGCSTLSYLEPGELAIGQWRKTDVYAKYYHNFTGIYMRAGQKFEFTTESPAWQNGSIDTDAAGYEPWHPSWLPPEPRRRPTWKMMALMFEIFAENHSASYPRDFWGIGLSRTLTVNHTGWMVAFANDNPLPFPFYEDNTGLVRVKVKRIQ